MFIISMTKLISDIVRRQNMSATELVQDYLSYPLCPFNITTMTEVPICIQKITILNYNPDTDTSKDLTYGDFSACDSTQFPNSTFLTTQVLPILITIDDIEYRTSQTLWQVLSDIARSAIKVNSMRKKSVFPIYIRAGLQPVTSLLNSTILYYRSPHICTSYM